MSCIRIPFYSPLWISEKRRRRSKDIMELFSMRLFFRTKARDTTIPEKEINQTSFLSPNKTRTSPTFHEVSPLVPPLKIKEKNWVIFHLFFQPLRFAHPRRMPNCRRRRKRGKRNLNSSQVGFIQYIQERGKRRRRRRRRLLFRGKFDWWRRRRKAIFLIFRARSRWTKSFLAPKRTHIWCFVHLLYLFLRIFLCLV